MTGRPTPFVSSARRPSRPPSRTAAVAWLSVVLATSLAGGAPAGAQTAMTETGGLTIAILDLAEAPGLARPKPARTDSAPWRTSFGSERTTQREQKPAAGDGPLELIANADAVLIQGVHAAARLRRLFPPKIWRLVVSRGLAAGDAAVSSDAVTSDSVTSNVRLPPTTAIAIKAREGLQVTARMRELRLADPSTDASGDGEASATAIRIAGQGRAIWLASVALPAGCGETAACAAREGLEAWRATKRGEGAVTLVGGRTRDLRAQPTERPQVCAAHGIDSDLQAQPVSIAGAGPEMASAAGCITIVRLAD